MKGITIKLPEATLKALAEEAQASRRSIAAVVRSKLGDPAPGGASVYARTADLAGSLAGGHQPATNERRKFRRS